MSKNTDPITQISNILALADDPNATEAEREIAFGRAQRMSMKYQIDLAILRESNREKGEVERPVSRKIEVGQSGKRAAGAFSDLLGSIARSNDLRCVYYGNSHVELFGFSSDIDLTITLYMSIVTDMVRDCERYIETGEWRSHGLTIQKARKSWYAGYINRIGERIRMANCEAQREADEEYKGQGTLVLADRKKEVNKYYHEKAGRLASRQGIKSFSRAVSNRGSAAAERVDVSTKSARGIDS